MNHDDEIRSIIAFMQELNTILVCISFDLPLEPVVGKYDLSSIARILPREIFYEVIRYNDYSSIVIDKDLYKGAEYSHENLQFINSFRLKDIEKNIVYVVKTLGVNDERCIQIAVFMYEIQIALVFSSNLLPLDIYSRELFDSVCEKIKQHVDCSNSTIKLHFVV